MGIDEQLFIPREIWEEMARSIAEQAPIEACGLLAGLKGEVKQVYPIRNVMQSPARFKMDAQEQLKAFVDLETRGLELLAIYHSHPKGPTAPSETDIREFAYPGVAYLIWSPREKGWDAQGFWIAGGKAGEIPLRVQ